MSITKASLIDLNGQELILDADADTSITADTDDQIDIKIAGSDVITLTSSNTTLRSGSSLTINRTDNSIGGVITYGPSSGTGFTFNDANGDGIDFTIASTNLASFNSGEAVFNDGANDKDFRVESDSKTHALFVQGSDGFVGINATPSHPLEIAINSSGQQDLLLLSNDNTATSNTAGILFAPSNGITGARIEAIAIEDFSTSANRTADLGFSVRHNGTIAERWRIHSDGAFVSQAQTPVAIGGTPADANFTELASGYITLARDDTADADQVLFAKNGAIHTKLKTISGAFVIDSASGNVHLTANSNSLNYNGTTLKPFDSDDNLIDLGTSGARYKDLYLSGGAFLGGTGSANELDDYEEGTFTVSVNGCTESNATGYYIKVGDKVNFQYYTGASTFTAVQASFTGLPFTTSGSTQNYATFLTTHNTATTDAFGGYLNRSATTGYFVTKNSTSVPNYNTGTQYFMISGFYFTN